MSEKSKCPECGEPIEDLRTTCVNCGYEYRKEDYDNTEAGNEFLVGSNIDDQGEEITDKGAGVEGTGDDAEEPREEAGRK